MGEKRAVKFDFLNEKEISELYELFFGKVLIKKADFSYVDNLKISLVKENFVKSFVDRLPQQEIDILKIISKVKSIPYNFLPEKISNILNIPNTNIGKSVGNLIQRKFIFLRDNDNIVIPSIYFEIKDVVYDFVDCEERKYENKFLQDIISLINYFVSKNLKFSNGFAIYKKDYLFIEESFGKYCNLKRIEYNLISYFFSLAFMDRNGAVYYKNIENFFELSNIEKIRFFLKIAFPAVYSIISGILKNEKKDIEILTEDFKELWIRAFLSTEYSETPMKYSFANILSFLKDLDVIEIKDDKIIIKYYQEEFDKIKSEIKVSSNFNIYVNSNSNESDFYYPAMFCDFIKYNKIVEYEINENSIKKGVISGVTYRSMEDFFKKYNIELPSNVEQTVKMWFEKHSSFYYATGTMFFCENEEKGELFKTLIKNKVVNAFEVKKDAVFLIPDDEKEIFFDFLEKSGVNFYHKEFYKKFEAEKGTIVDIEDLL